VPDTTTGREQDGILFKKERIAFAKAMGFRKGNAIPAG